MKNLILTTVFIAIGHLNTFAQLSWEHTNGPEGAASWHLYYNKDYSFCKDFYFLYRTSDGLNWEKASSGHIGEIGINDSILVAQFYHENWSLPIDSTKLKISHDHGSTWSEITYPAGLEYLFSIATCSKGIYIPIGSHIIYRSKDEGITWDSMMAPAQYAYDAYSFDDRVYITNSREIWRIDSTGDNWEQINLVLSPTAYISELFVHGQHIVYATNSNKIWHSHDDGLTWTQSTSSTSDIRNFALVDTSLFATGIVPGIFKSNDYGATWSSLDLGGFGTQSESISAAGGNLLVTSYDSGISRWDASTEKIVPSNLGLYSARIYKIAKGDGQLWAATGNGLTSYDFETQIWTTKGPPQPWWLPLNIIVANDSGLVCAMRDNKFHFFISKNSGMTWDSVSIIPTLNTNQPIQVISVVDQFIFIQINSSTYRSADFGQTWQQIENIYNIVKFNNLYLTTMSGKVVASDDQGLTWYPYASIPGIGIYRLYLAGNRLFATTHVIDLNLYEFPIYTSADGINWINANQGLEGHYFGLDPDTGADADFIGYCDTYYAYHTDEGFYQSIDTGLTWTPFQFDGGENILLIDSILYKGGFGGGVLKSVFNYTCLPPVSVTETKNTLVSLEVVPNPVADNCTISLKGCITDEGILTLHHASGQLCQRIVLSNVNEPIQLQTNHLPTGAYLVRISTKTLAISRTIIVQD